MERADRYLIGTEDPNLDPGSSIPHGRGTGQPGRDCCRELLVTPTADSAPDRRHVRVALPHRYPRREHLVESATVRVGEADLVRGDVLLEVAPVLRTGNRYDVVAAVEHP